MTSSQHIIDRLKRVANIIQLDALEKQRSAVRNRANELLALIILLEEKLEEEKK
jgi:hypothetical protein|tara:strand:+ start:1037 stop:1198 length:162 start_codon:yes stop_codon:yes gene_type:complete